MKCGTVEEGPPRGRPVGRLNVTIPARKLGTFSGSVEVLTVYAVLYEAETNNMLMNQA